MQSCVKCDNGLSDCFVASCGVRQGKNLSPILFSIYLNDLLEFMSRCYSGLITLK